MRLRLIHVLPLLYYLVTRGPLSVQELSRLLGLSTATTRKLLWSARRAKLVDYARVGDSLLVEPSNDATSVISSVDYVARRRNKMVFIAGGGVIYTVLKLRKGIRAYPVPLDKLCSILREETSKPTQLDNKDTKLPPKTKSMLRRVLITLGCTGRETNCILLHLCRAQKNRGGIKNKPGHP